MSNQVRGQLVYRTVQSIALPAQLECCARVRDFPEEVQDLTAEFRSIRGRAEGLQLRVGGEVLIQGILVSANGGLRALKTASVFGLELSLAEQLLAGHNVIEPQVTGIIYTVNRMGKKGADIAVVITVTFNVNVMAAVTSPMAHCHFKQAFLPLVQVSEAQNFHREVLLPLDPPGRKIVRTEIREQEPRVDLSLPVVVSGTAEEEILYIGLDGRVYDLCHISNWNCLWPAVLTHEGDPVANVHAEIIGARLLSSGHTLSLSIREEIGLQVYQEREQDILVAGEYLPKEQTIMARIPMLLAERTFTELILSSVPLQQLPNIPGRPQVRLLNLSGSADYGQVTIEGELEVCFPYVDHEGKERTHHATLTLRKVLATEESRLGQMVKVEGQVENAQPTLTENGNLELKILCTFQICLLALEEVALVAEAALPANRFKKAWVQIEELIGQQNRDLLLEQTVVFTGQKAIVLNHIVCPKINGIFLGHGTLFSRGEIELSLYCLGDFGEEYCQEYSLPWQVTLNIPGTEPQSVPDVNVQADLLPLAIDKDGGKTTVRVACTITGKVYRPKVMEAAIGLLDTTKALTERQVLGTVCQAAELEVLIKPRQWSLNHEAHVAAEVKQISWETANERVDGMGELSLTVTYAKPEGVLQLWQEVRPFELSFLCPEAEPGQEVYGGLMVKEVLYQTGPSKKAQRAGAAGQYLRANVVLMADLVLL